MKIQDRLGVINCVNYTSLLTVPCNTVFDWLWVELVLLLWSRLDGEQSWGTTCPFISLDDFGRKCIMSMWRCGGICVINILISFFTCYYLALLNYWVSDPNKLGDQMYSKCMSFKNVDRDITSIECFKTFVIPTWLLFS